MGFKLFTSEEFKVKPNQELEIKKPIELEEEKRGVVHGVIHKKGKPAKDCLVKLFKVDHDKFIGIGFTFTDCFGQFLFPVYDTNCPLVIKVFCLHEKTSTIDLKSACHPSKECEEESLEKDFDICLEMDNEFVLK